MNISEFLSPEATFCSLKLSSKKKILEKVSEVMAESVDATALEIFESLFARERLGTTGLGNGIAIPHGRVAGCDRALSVLILLEEPVDYDAPDGKPVDIVFAILVPEQADNDQLRCLAQIAETLSNPNLVSQIRHAHCSEALYDIVATAALKAPQ